MEIVLGAIRRLKPVEKRSVRLVQTMVPLPFDSARARPIVEDWRKKMYDICLTTVYNGMGAPSLDDEETAHYPLLVADRDEFSATDSVAQVAIELLPQFDSIVEVVAPLDINEE